MAYHGNIAVSYGKRLATLKPMNREWVRLDQIAPHVINALIATEDHRFFHHTVLICCAR